MGNGDQPLTGFTWKSGKDRDTFGIIVWSDVFTHVNQRTGEKIAIVLMDSQGLFDTQTTVEENSKIFSLSALMSSIQIFNLQGVVQEDQLQYLQLIIGYSKWVSSAGSSSDNSKAFQELIFLIRDWNHVHEHDLGREGGDEYISSVLSSNSNNDKSLIEVRSQIKQAFEKVTGILLPTPNAAVRRGANGKQQLPYDGRWSLMDEEFKSELKSAIESILKPENLKVKKVNGQAIDCKELSELIATYLNVFTSSTAPSIQSIYTATADTFLKSLENDLLKDYEASLRASINTQDSSFYDDFIDKRRSLKDKALRNFDNSKKIGSATNIRNHRDSLSNKIDEVSNRMKKELQPQYLRALDTKIKAETFSSSHDEIEKMLLRELVNLDLQNKLLLSIRDDIPASTYNRVHNALQDAVRDSWEQMNHYNKYSNVDMFKRELKSKGYGSVVTGV